MLIGLFWEVEHGAVYKPTPELKGVASHWKVQRQVAEVYAALRAFEKNLKLESGKRMQNINGWRRARPASAPVPIG